MVEDSARGRRLCVYRFWSERGREGACEEEAGGQSGRGGGGGWRVRRRLGDRVGEAAVEGGV